VKTTSQGGVLRSVALGVLVICVVAGCGGGSSRGPAIAGTWRYEVHTDENVYDAGSITFTETATGAVYRATNFYGYGEDGTWTRQGATVQLQGAYEWAGRVVDGHRMEGTTVVEGKPATWVTTR